MPGQGVRAHILQLKIPHVPWLGRNIVKQISENIFLKYREMENIRVWTKVRWEGSPVPIHLVWLGIVTPSASLSGEKDVPEHLNRGLHSWNKAWYPWPVGVYFMTIPSFICSFIHTCHLNTACVPGPVPHSRDCCSYKTESLGTVHAEKDKHL